MKIMAYIPVSIVVVSSLLACSHKKVSKNIDKMDADEIVSYIENLEPNQDINLEIGLLSAKWVSCENGVSRSYDFTDLNYVTIESYNHIKNDCSDEGENLRQTIFDDVSIQSNEKFHVVTMQSSKGDIDHQESFFKIYKNSSGDVEIARFKEIIFEGNYAIKNVNTHKIIFKKGQ